MVERQVLSFDCNVARICRTDMLFAACLGEQGLAVALRIAGALTFVARGVAGGAAHAFLVER